MKNSFFAERKAAAVLKHGILGRYLRIFCSKTGLRSPDHRVIYLDGYAGPGMYDNGEPGSPALAVGTAERLADCRELYGIYVENNPALAQELETRLAETGHQHIVLQGTIEDHLEEVLATIGKDQPLLAFFDPFGLGVSMNLLTSVMAHARYETGHRHGPATEVLLNFSRRGLERSAGHLTSSNRGPAYTKARSAILAHMNGILGGDWWMPIWASRSPDRTPQIVEGYVGRLVEATSARGWYRVPVPRTRHGPPIYDLVLLTHYPEEGIWNFNECVCNAMEDFESFCKHGQLDLEPLDEREKRWVGMIKRNVLSVLETTGEFVVWQHLSDVLSGCMGLAREKHLRCALKELHKEGHTSHNGKGELRAAVVGSAVED